jgi:hypothetical protein
MARSRSAPEPPIYTFRVRIKPSFSAPREAREIWRDIEIAANQSLAVLGETIPLAFGFTDPHLWSFFLSGKAWDPTTEYALVVDREWGFEPRGRAANRVRIRDLLLPGTTGKKEFLFLFDYGDEWDFGVKLRRTQDAVEPGARYPRVVASHGEAPPQYPDLDDDDWDDEPE